MVSQVWKGNLENLDRKGMLDLQDHKALLGLLAHQ